MASVRKAIHAGSWYTSCGSELNKELECWLGAADMCHGPARAIIAPHAGYSYCGACAGVAYRQVIPGYVRRIFILGPSHYVRLARCALSSAYVYQTPLYNLPVDREVCRELKCTGQFEVMDLNTDEEEHSIEMQLPFIAKVMEGYRDSFTIIPILVGSLSPEKEALYGRILAPYLADPQTLFVISSDFCHWGQRFRYTYYERSSGPIHMFIHSLDKMAMDMIETLNPTMFTNYLKQYGNTICGRHPISLLLQAIHSLQGDANCQRMKIRFLKYAQSNQCNNMNDSSVSYASASLVLE